MINRGGEKIFPEEIEAILLRNPAVAEAAAFPILNPKYGEDVSAAVVLKGTTDSAALRAFCRTCLADFKVPATIWITSTLPMNAAGKLDRHMLPALFNSTSKSASRESNVS